MASALSNNWLEQFQGLSGLSDDLKASIASRAVPVRVAGGAQIFGPGHTPEYMLLLISGRIRVQKVSEQGREIFLYRVVAGESCVMTTACLLAYEDYQAEGLAETDVLCAGLPRPFFDQLLQESDPFRRFVFLAYSRRMTDLFHVIDEVVFKRLDIRLAALLLRLQGEQGRRLAATQQDLANELGSAREVVSRQLQEFRRRGWVELGRGWVEILHRDGLESLAQQ